MIPDRRAATEGEVFMWRGEQMTVAPKTAGNNGNWVCIRCAEAFPHNLAKDTHCHNPVKRGTRKLPGGPDAPGEQARHVLAWFNKETGQFEVP